MYCPKCGYKLMCGCKTCYERIPEGHKPEEWDETGELIKCPNCGLQKHCSWWESLDYDISIGKLNSLTEMLESKEKNGN